MLSSKPRKQQTFILMPLFDALNWDEARLLLADRKVDDVSPSLCQKDESSCKLHRTFDCESRSVSCSQTDVLKNKEQDEVFFTVQTANLSTCQLFQNKLSDSSEGFL